MSEINETINVIRESYLTKKQKIDLINYIEKNGSDEIFYQKFNALLIEEYDKRVEIYDKNFIEYENQCSLLDNELKQKEKKLEKMLEEKFSAVDSDDTQEKESILNSYYKEINRIHIEYEERLRKIGDEYVVAATIV